MAHVLIVDDDRAIRELLQIALELEGYSVMTLSNGVGVLDALGVLPDGSVILLDLMMPFVSGWDVCAELQREPAALRSHKLIVMSAGVASGDECPPPAQALLAKPFDLQRMLDTVAHLASPCTSILANLGAAVPRDEPPSALAS